MFTGITTIKMGKSVVDQSVAGNPNDIVITGISGVFPGSKNLVELEDNLRNKTHLITSNYRDFQFIIILYRNFQFYHFFLNFLNCSARAVFFNFSN